MNSPFPGMDPFLEHPGFWRDFHQRFITYWCDWLAENLPDHYDVRIDERLGVVQGGGDPAVRFPDVSVTQSRPLPEVAGPMEPAVAVLDREPVRLKVRRADAATESFLRVVYEPDSSLVAVLELLSPTNKEGEGRTAYLTKRNQMLGETVHLVELDLLLGGARVPVRGKLPPAHYYAYVARGDRRPECEVYAWAVTERLTRVRLPLKPSDPDVVFDLPGLLEQTYRRGRYARHLPYDAPPPVALPENLGRWVAERLTAWRAAR